MIDAEQLDNFAQAYTDAFPYSEENHVMLAAYGNRVASYIERQKVKTALSLGIGYVEVADKILAKLISRLLNRYVVVDGSPRIIEGFRRSLGAHPPQGLEILEGYFETFKCSERFEIIEAGFILEHVDDPTFVLNRMHQFLQPNGRIFIAVPNARSLHRELGHLAGFLKDMYTLSPSDLALGHKHYFDLEAISRVVTNAGFKVAKVEGLFLKPFSTQQLKKLDLPPVVWQALTGISVNYPSISNAIYLEATA